MRRGLVPIADFKRFTSKYICFCQLNNEVGRRATEQLLGYPAEASPLATPCERLPGRGAAAAPIARAERTADALEGVRGETAGPAGRASWPRVSGSHAIIEIIAILRAAETRCVSRLPPFDRGGLDSHLETSWRL